MQIHLDKFLPNPYRDFETYPIDPKQVELLRSSIHDTGLWPFLVFRKHPTKEGFFQLAMGHHRIEAAKLEGIETVSVQLPHVNLTDEQMVDIMVRENMTQRGYNAAAIQDSVQAVIHLIVLNAPLGTNVPSKQSAAVKGWLGRGDGIGWKSVMSYMHDTVTEREAKEAIATIKQTGKMAKIMSVVVAEYEAELEAAKEEEKKADTPVKKKKARKKVEELQQEVASAAIAAEATDDIAIFDERCVSLFPNLSQAETFRKAITSPGAMEVIPFDQQYDLAKQITEKFAETADGKKNVTASSINMAVKSLVQSLHRDDRKEDERRQRQREEREAMFKLTQHVTRFRAAITRLGSDGYQLAKVYKEWDFKANPTPPLLIKHEIESTIKTLQDLLKHAA